MSEVIDFNAGDILDGKLTLDDAAMLLAQLVAGIAQGSASKPEAPGHREYFIMYKHQSMPSLEDGCHA